MAVVDPTWINSLTYDGIELRRIQGLNVMTNGTTLGVRAGVIPGSGGFTVTVVGTAITVTSGLAWVYQSGQGVYGVSLTSGASLTLNAPHATLPRIDLVYLRVWDNSVDASGLNQADAVYLAGTAASSPVAPTPAGTQIYIPLAQITVPQSGGGSPSVSQSMLAKTVAPGGILPDAAATGYYAGQYRDNGTNLERYSGSTWSAAAPTGGADWEQDLKLGSTRKLIIGTDCNLYRSAANTLKTDDDLLIKEHKAKGSEGGTKTFTFTTQTSSTMAVTFATAFAATPKVFCNITGTAGATLGWAVKATSITTTGFTIIASGPSASWSAVDVDWMAFQS